MNLQIGKKFLIKNNIDAKVHYPTPVHLQPAAKFLKYKKGDKFYKFGNGGNGGSVEEITEDKFEFCTPFYIRVYIYSGNICNII